MPFTSSSILVYENTSNTVVDFQSGVSTPVSLNISSTYDGVTLDYVISRAGYTKPAGQFVGGGAIDISVSPTERKDPDGTPAYTATTSANIAVSFGFSPLRCFIDIGDASVSSQTIVDEIEDALATQDGCRFLIESNGATCLQAVLAGQTYLLLGQSYRLRRASAGDVNAAIDTYVIGADGVVLDGTNGGVQFLTAQDIGEAVWNYATRTLTVSAGGATLSEIEASTVLAKEATVVALGSPAQASALASLVSSNQTEHDATQSAIAALPTPLDATATQAAAAAALTAYDAATAADVAAIPTNPVLTTDPRLDNLDAAVSTRLASASYTAPPTVAAIRADIERAGGMLDTVPTLAEINASTVLAKESTLTAIKAKTDQLSFTSGNINAIAQVVSDKTGYSLTTEERQAIATEVEAAILNEGDGQAIIDAIVQAIGNSNIDEISLVAAIRADIERAGGTLAGIKPDLTIINNGVKNASLIIPHTDDLT